MAPFGGGNDLVSATRQAVCKDRRLVISGKDSCHRDLRFKRMVGLFGDTSAPECRLSRKSYCISSH